MILDSQQQKNQLLNLLQRVEIKGPYYETAQQFVQVEDMIQAVAAANIAPPEAPSSAPAAPAAPMVQPAAPAPEAKVTADPVSEKLEVK